MRERDGRARSRTFALGAGRLFLGQEMAVAAFDEGFHQGRGEPGALLRHRRGDLQQRRRTRSALGHLRLHPIQPLVQGFMRPASKAVLTLPLLKNFQRENRTHRSPSF